MGCEGEIYPLFFDIEHEIEAVNVNKEEAITNLIARDPVLYKKTLFRAFLNYSKKETDKMTIQEYIDNTIILEDVLKLWHAPFIDHND